ncbi:MAG TPA: hypothetical protein VFU88_21080 [Ktedonobacterales bacterium]|nr:hypothetical protein [Ktedonobacterales bacterium]
MDDREREDSNGADDFHAEVSDLRGSADPGGAHSAPPATSPLDARLTPRQRLARLGIVALAGLLAFAVVWNVTATLRERAASPTATSPIGSGPVYLLPNPPGVVVTLDGHALNMAPTSSTLRALRLSPGRHTLDWRSQLFPFQPLRCTVSQPRASTDTCPLVRRGALPESFADPFGDVIGLHDSLAALSSDDAAQVTAAMQQALDGIRSTADVRTGEHYLTVRFDGSTAPTVAKQPLRATLSYELFPDDSYPEPCILGQPYIPCRFPGQFCAELCTVAQPPLALTDGGRVWLAAALVRATWTYATLSGQTVAASAGASTGAQLAILRITQDAAGWHVTPVLGHTPGLDIADDLVCDPARRSIAGTSWSFMLVDQPPGSDVQLASDATPADGCVVVLTHGEPAVFLERFGVLLAANENARNPNDNIPEANAHEQALARQLMAQLGP